MPTMTPERIEEVIAGWRRGLDAEELDNPAGTMFAGRDFVEYEITATGGHDTGDTCPWWAGGTCL